jgi:hypothetical protein
MTAARRGSAARTALRLAVLTGAAAAGWALLTTASDQAAHAADRPGPLSALVDAVADLADTPTAAVTKPAATAVTDTVAPIVHKVTGAARPIVHTVVDSIRPVVVDTAPVPVADVVDQLDVAPVDTAPLAVADQPGPVGPLLAALTGPGTATHQTVGVQHQLGAAPGPGSFALTLFGDLPPAGTPPAGTPPAGPVGGGDHSHGSPVVVGTPGPPAVTATSTLPRPDVDAGRGRDGDDRRRDSRQPIPGNRPG